MHLTVVLTRVRLALARKPIRILLERLPSYENNDLTG